MGHERETSLDQWQVPQDLVEQVVQELEAVLIRLAPPPIPKAEMSFRTSGAPHSGQETPFSPPIRTSASKRRPHCLQTNSYIGIGYYFNRIDRINLL